MFARLACCSQGPLAFRSVGAPEFSLAYTANVVKVMIASSGDVASERRVIGEWNVTYAEDRKIVLIPLAWETHASPIMGDRPQAIINRPLLKDADLLVAAFWTRLGRPSGGPICVVRRPWIILIPFRLLASKSRPPLVRRFFGDSAEAAASFSMALLILPTAAART